MTFEQTERFYLLLISFQGHVSLQTYLMLTLEITWKYTISHHHYCFQEIQQSTDRVKTDAALLISNKQLILARK